MSFHDVRFPEDLSFGAVGGPRFKTTVVTTAGGLEQRNQDWEQVRAEYDVSQNIKTQEELDKLLDFFYARRGRTYGFRFKDWADYKLDNNIAVGDGSKASFPIKKVYNSGGFVYERQITKPVSGSLTEVRFDGVATGQGSLNDSTGKIVFPVPPADGVVIAVTLEFDVPVRFDTDQMAISLENFELFSWGQIPLKELKNE